MKRIFIIIAPGVLLVIGLMAVISCSASSQPTTTTPGTNTQVKPTGTAEPGPDYTPGATAGVLIENYAYSPAEITITAGTTVTWTNKDSVRHTVTTRNPLFDSGLFAKGESFSYTFNQAGDFEYYCIPHPYMTGKVSVK